MAQRSAVGVWVSVSSEAQKLVDRVRRFSDLPIAVGFGISTQQQVLDVQRYADAAVVGSAIVHELEKVEGTPDVSKRIGTFARNLLPAKSLRA